MQHQIIGRYKGGQHPAKMAIKTWLWFVYVIILRCGISASYVYLMAAYKVTLGIEQGAYCLLTAVKLAHYSFDLSNDIEKVVYKMFTNFYLIRSSNKILVRLHHLFIFKQFTRYLYFA